MSGYIKLGVVSTAFYKARCSEKISAEAYGAATLILSKLEPETDIAPIVHCRDCFHWSNVGGGWCNQFDFRASPDLACNAGEKPNQAQ